MQPIINYNPDVLTCLANLSNDEVFTPPSVVNQMLDQLPNELWSDKNATFLDPVCKTGVFLREIALRLNKGLEKEIPDQQERLNHIYTKQLFGLGLTELTSLLSRRSVYCTKTANGKYSVCTDFNDKQGNIRYKRMEHKWQNGRCTFCGASEAEYSRDDALETYAYQFIHTNEPAKLFNDMKFDVIIGNPPYQLSDGGGTGDSAKPLYHLFIQQAKKLNPRHLSMIVPARWMKGGKGLTNFRDEMLLDTRIKSVCDFEDASECFPGITLDGGVCYFLWDKEYEGKATYTYKSKSGEINISKRYLKTDLSNTVIRDFRQLSIIEKTSAMNESKLSSIVEPRNPYGISSDFFNTPEKYPNIKQKDKPEKNSYRIHGVKGKKGGSKRVVAYIDQGSVMSETEANDYKLFFSKAYMTTSTVPPKIILGNPGDICTETFLKIGSFKNELECLNLLSYIKTKFCEPTPTS